MSSVHWTFSPGAAGKRRRSGAGGAGAGVWSACCRSIMHYTSYLRTKDCTNNGYVTDMLEHNTMINIDTGVHMISYITQT